MMIDAAIDTLASRHARIARLRDVVVVVKVGGSIQDDSTQMRQVMRDVAALSALGALPVIVHGGGKAISAAMTAAGLQARFVQGQRYTDEATLAIVERVLVRHVNSELCSLLGEEGAAPYPLHSLGSCVLFGERTGTDQSPGRPSEDLGLVGRITRVAAPVIRGLTLQRFVPVIAPVALTGDGAAKLNVNADLAAGAIAAALRAPVFMLVSDTTGVRTAPDPAAPHAPSLSKAQVESLSAAGIIAGGMLPKLNACFEAIRGGSAAVSIIDGRQPRTILSAALAEPGEPIAGTWVVA